MDEIAPGIFRWTAPHPTWRTSVEEVISYALLSQSILVVVDPQLPVASDARRAELLGRLDGLVAGAARLELMITIPYHTRSTETLYERFWSTVPTSIWGHSAVKKRLTRRAPLTTIPAGKPGSAAEVAGGTALAFTIGRPRRSESPLFFPRLRAVVFGDAVVGVGGGLRFWNQSSSTTAAWYRDVFGPTLQPLLEHDIDHVLVTHGESVIGDGRRALAECLAAAPVRMY